METQNTVQLNPTVQKWMEADDKPVEDVLPVLIVTVEPLKDYDFLRNVSGNTYTGRITKEQLKKLMKDTRIVRISSEIEQKH